MTEQFETNRETGLMFALRQEGIDNGAPLSGRYVFVDLDQGSCTTVTLNDANGLTPEFADAAPWRGTACLPVLQEKISALMGLDKNDISAMLMNDQIMADCGKISLRAEMGGNDSLSVLSSNGAEVTYRKITDALAAMNETLDPLLAHIVSSLDEKSQDGSLVFYGVSAGFVPLQYFIRRAIRNDELYDIALGEDRLFRFIPDDGKIVMNGMRIRQELIDISERAKRIPFDIALSLILLHKDGTKETSEIVLAKKGQEKEELSPNMISLFAAPGANLHFKADGKDFYCSIPEDYLNESSVVSVGLTLTDGKINILLQKKDAGNPIMIMTM